MSTISGVFLFDAAFFLAYILVFINNDYYF